MKETFEIFIGLLGIIISVVLMFGSIVYAFSEARVVAPVFGFLIGLWLLSFVFASA